MPGKRIKDLTALSGAGSANDDDVVIFDTNADTTKRISRSQLAEGMIGDLPFLYFHGVRTTDPTQRFNGDSLVIGDGYLRSSDMIFRYYTSSGWRNYEQISVAAAQAWAEGTLPGGAGTYSSKEWSEVSEAWAVNPENTAVEPNKYSALHYAAKAQGYANVAGAAVGFIDREDLTTLLADTSLTYTAGLAGTVAAGDVIRTRIEGFAYIVAASAASDQHITTAGSVKLYEANPFTSKTRLKRMSISSLSNGATVMADGATYRWDSTIAVQVHQADTTESYYVAPNAAADGAWVRDTNKSDISAFDQIKMRMRLGRVDFVALGDSNQLFGGHGWDHGFQKALVDAKYSMYATGLISTNENNADGGGVGYLYSFNAAQPVLGAISGAPSVLDDYLKTTGGSISPHNYAYLASGTFVNGNDSGMIVGVGCPLRPDINALRYHLCYGTFTTGSGSFRISWRNGASPFTQQAESALISTNTGAETMQVATLDLSSNAGFASIPIQAKLTGNTSGITGPYFSLWQRVEVVSSTAGFSYHTLHGLGGDSLRDMGNSMQSLSDTTLSYYFEQVRRLQGDFKTVVVCVNSGLNDRNETLASVGPAAIADADSYQAFVDNFVAIQNRIETLWTANGWSLDELFWIVFPSHPVSAPDDAELVSYRKAISEYLVTRPRAQMVDLTTLTTATEMLANGWYASAGADRNHLTQTGFEQLSTRVVRAIK